MNHSGNLSLTLQNASSAVFDQTFQATLPIVGLVKVELMILFTRPHSFTFVITVQIAGKTFSWNQNVTGNITIPISLVDGFGLTLDIAGWTLSSAQLSFDLLVRITGPFGISVTLFHQHVNILLPSKEEISAFAAMDLTRLEQFALRSPLRPAGASPALVQAGPAGGQGGHAFDDARDSGAIGRQAMSDPTVHFSKITVRHGDAINAVLAAYTNGASGGSDGRPDGGVDILMLDPDEKLLEVSGFLDMFDDTITLVGLTLKTSKQPFGPFGRNSSFPFQFFVPSVTRSEIIGFLGRAGDVIDALGVYIRSFDT